MMVHGKGLVQTFTRINMIQDMPKAFYRHSHQFNNKMQPLG
jgi:hypothetical protein